MNKLLQRVITGMVLLVILLVIFFLLPPAAAIGCLAVFVSIGAWEWSAFVAGSNLAGRIAYTLALVVLIVGLLWFVPTPIKLEWLLWIALAWWVTAFFWLLRYPTAIRREIAALCGVLTLLPAWGALVYLLRQPDRGAEFVLFVLSAVWAADIGAYFVGRRLGNRRLAPSISPGKTWEGVAGGLTASVGLAFFGAAWFNISPLIMVPAILSIAVVSIIGDLTVSMFKRDAGLKDSGNLFPGHGGVLDRVDSVTAAVPLFALEATWIGLVTV